MDAEKRIDLILPQLTRILSDTTIVANPEIYDQGKWTGYHPSKDLRRVAKNIEKMQKRHPGYGYDARLWALGIALHHAADTAIDVSEFPQSILHVTANAILATALILRDVYAEDFPLIVSRLDAVAIAAYAAPQP